MTAGPGSPDASRRATAGTRSLGSPMAESAATGSGNRSFKNTLTLSELVDQLVRQDAPEVDRAHAALALQYLSLNVDKAMSIVQMPAAISGLVRIIWEGTDEARQHAAGALAHLAVNEEAEYVIAHSEGVLAALAALLSSGTEDAKEEAAAALENLSYSTESAALAAKTGDLIPGLAMLLHTGKGKAIENAVGALQNLAMLADSRVEIAAAPRLLVSIANVMWSASPKAQEGSAAIVGNLAVNSEIRTIVGCTDGIIDGLVMLLVHGTEKAKSDAAAALGNLAVNTELRTSILEMPRALYGLKCMLMEGSEQHAGEAACCLQNLAVTTLDHKVRIAATEDLLQGLVNLMLRCQPASQYQEDACSALLNLVVGCTQNKKAVATVNGVMQALQRSLHAGSERAQEHGAAILQNLTFNSHSNRLAVLAVPELLTSVSNLVADARAGKKKAGEYAAACLASLARTREGALAIVRDQVAIEGLIQMATPENSMAERKASISALQALTQTPEAGALLFRSELPTRCFLPVLRNWQTLQHDETGRRIILQASIGMAFLSGLDTRLLDLIPDIGVDVLVSALVATAQGEHTNNFKYKAIDLLVPLNILASRDQNKAQLQRAGTLRVLLHILNNPEIAEGDVVTVIEAARLLWHLAFNASCRKEILELKILDKLQGRSQGCESWSSGLAWQLAPTHLAVQPPARRPTVEGNSPQVMIIFDSSDGEVQSAVAENLMQGGHTIWSGNFGLESPANFADFEEAVNAAKLAVVIVSPCCELSPCCRSQTRYIRDSSLPYLCLNVGSTYERMYVEHGYLKQELGPSIKCTPAMFQGGDASALNGIIDEFLMSGSKSWKADMWLDQAPSDADADRLQDEESRTGFAISDAARAVGDVDPGLAGKASRSRERSASPPPSGSQHKSTSRDGSHSAEHLEDLVRHQAGVIRSQQAEIQALRAQLERQEGQATTVAITAAVEQALSRFEGRIGARIHSEIQASLPRLLDPRNPVTAGLHVDGMSSQESASYRQAFVA